MLMLLPCVLVNGKSLNDMSSGCIVSLYPPPCSPDSTKHTQHTSTKPEESSQRPKLPSKVPAYAMEIL